MVQKEEKELWWYKLANGSSGRQGGVFDLKRRVIILSEMMEMFYILFRIVPYGYVRL